MFSLDPYMVASETDSRAVAARKAAALVIQQDDKERAKARNKK